MSRLSRSANLKALPILDLEFRLRAQLCKDTIAFLRNGQNRPFIVVAPHYRRQGSF
jgi:hypothetical protein